MKILVKAVAAAGLLTLAACGGGADDNKAEAIEANAENVAENYEAAAENTSNDQAAEALEDKADATREAGDEKADAVDANDGGNGSVESNVSGM
jgi:outer membrane PBP1 activator LpoA protein